EEIYMKPPEGYSKALPGQVCKLNKSLYGLKQITQVKKALDDKFTIKDLGLARYFLGLTTGKPTTFPLPQNLKLSLDKGVPLKHPDSYRRLVGRLLYLSMTRPDISYSVQHLSQFISAPKEPHMQAALPLLRYLKGTISKGLFYPIQPQLKVAGFSDADWASCLMTRRSLTGYCIFLGHTLVSWKTKKQVTVSRSSTEAAYKSMTTTTCELVWLAYLLKDLKIPVQVPITLFDNKAA
ncbi:RNA-directed DNA polymerase, partial [Tanacetum coccineum]